MSFHNRGDAGRRLARALLGIKERQPVVLALPRGGVPVAAEVTRALKASLDVILVRKIGVPFHSELAMGAVVNVSAPLVVRNEEIIRMAKVSEEDFSAIRDHEIAEIKRRRMRYVGKRAQPDLNGRVVIVVDDGIATGATTRAALRAVRKQNPSWVILAVPVAPTDTLNELRAEADEIVCLEQHESFDAVGAYYADFEQTSDEEVARILATSPVESLAVNAGANC